MKSGEFMIRAKVGNAYMTPNNPNNYITIIFKKGNQTQTRKAIIEGNTGSKSYCVYEYVVGSNDEDDSFFDGTVYIDTTVNIPSGIVYDNVGHANSSQNGITLERGGTLWDNKGYNKDSNKIYIDVTKPKINDACIEIEDAYGYRQINNNYYLKRGSQVRIGVTFNKSVYEQGKGGNDYMTANNSQNYIFVRFTKSNGSIKTCRAVIVGNNTSKGRQYCVYQYTVAEDSFFDGSAYVTTSITIPSNMVYDNTGTANSYQNVTLRRSGSLWNNNYNADNNKIYVDAIKPKVSDAYIDMKSNYGYQQTNGNFYLKRGSQIRIEVTFSENVYEQGKSRK